MNRLRCFKCTVAFSVTAIRVWLETASARQTIFQHPIAPEEQSNIVVPLNVALAAFQCVDIQWSLTDVAQLLTVVDALVNGWMAVVELEDFRWIAQGSLRLALDGSFIFGHLRLMTRCLFIIFIHFLKIFLIFQKWTGRDRN